MLKIATRRRFNPFIPKNSLILRAGHLIGFPNAFFVLLWLLAQASHAQDLSALTSVSTEAQSQHFQLSCTVGEPVIWTGASAQLVVTQGFQQPEYQGLVSIHEADVATPWRLAFSPNPATTHLNFYYEPPAAGYIYFQIFDTAGRLCTVPTRLPETGIYRFEFSNLDAGAYTIRFFDGTGNQAAYPFIVIR